ncbi:hypothetical protein BCR35DRAFT_334074 [Leucosporidium creatinivorum]|uniref:Uncharacterized protein n=1 Tax=Leucosporidium creatinivorum TaxID=106004 RepID=A0A1Y2EKX9_9BASI|nr:hypothetical protein BCR35DRAFT_334074 [Leucosporidium creatinivorum]
MSSLFSSTSSAPLPISPHGLHYARRFHELLVPLESLVTEWNGAISEQRSLGEETISTLNHQGYYSSTRFAVIHSLLWYMEEHEKLKNSEQFAVYPATPPGSTFAFTSSPTEYARRTPITPPSCNSPLGPVHRRSSQDHRPPPPPPSPGFGFYGDEDSVMAPARARSMRTFSMRSSFGASSTGAEEDVKPFNSVEGATLREKAMCATSSSLDFPSASSALPSVHRISHELGAPSSFAPAVRDLPVDTSHTVDLPLNEEDVYILVDRSLNTPSNRDAARVDSPPSFTSFEAIEHPTSPILQLSPPSQHLLIFHFPPRSFTPTPKVDFGSGHWWRNQICRGVHPMASNSNWTGRCDPPSKMRRRNRVLHHFETCQLGEAHQALRDFAKVLRLAEGGK